MGGSIYVWRRSGNESGDGDVGVGGDGEAGVRVKESGNENATGIDSRERDSAMIWI